MIRIDALLFLFIIEFLILFSILSIYLLSKKKEALSQEKAKTDNNQNLKHFLRKEISDIQKALIEEKEEQKNGDASAKGLSFKKVKGKFLVSILENLKNSENSDISWPKVIKDFDSTTNMLVKKINVADSNELSMKQTISKQNKEVKKLRAYQTMLIDLQTDFEKMSTTNSDLSKKLAEMIPEAERSKELQGLLDDFEKNKSELNNCLGTLEQENERLNEKMDRQDDEVDSMATDYNKLLLEKGDLKKEIAQGKETLEKSKKAYEQLSNNFNTLEDEYNRLYEATKSEDE